MSVEDAQNLINSIQEYKTRFPDISKQLDVIHNKILHSLDRYNQQTSSEQVLQRELSACRMKILGLIETYGTIMGDVKKMLFHLTK